MGRKGKGLSRLEALLGEDHIETLAKAGHLQKILLHLQYEGKAARGKNLKQIDAVLRFFKHEVNGHMREEEKVIFPYLRRHVPRLEPLLSLLVSEHREFRRKIRILAFLGTRLAGPNLHFDGTRAIEKLKETGNYLVCLLKGHLQEESEILYRVADRELRVNEKERLVKKVREGERRWHDSNSRKKRPVGR